MADHITESRTLSAEGACHIQPWGRAKRNPRNGGEASPERAESMTHILESMDRSFRAPSTMAFHFLGLRPALCPHFSATPNGVEPNSPGLATEGRCPGSEGPVGSPTLKALRTSESGTPRQHGRNPFRVGHGVPLPPRATRYTREPWAVGQNAFGVLGNRDVGKDEGRARC